MHPVLVYITTKDKPQAVHLARALLESRLIACANIMAADSLYSWEGRIEEGTECVLIAKSRQAQVPAITDRVKALHSYACPCVASVRIEGGNPDFLAWIGREVAP